MEEQKEPDSKGLTFEQEKELIEIRFQRDWDLQGSRNAAEAKQKHFDAVMMFGRTAVNSIVIINGAAGLGLFTLMGNGLRAMATPNVLWFNPLDLGLAAGLFGVGAFLGVLAAGLSYLTQMAFATAEGYQTGTRDWEQRTELVNAYNRWHWRGQIGRSIIIALAVMAYLCFGFGGASTFWVLT